ncbi:hypothetical protein LOC67_18250 [Stieleria sp. JC731]|uniref:hypothetical protein n=1 Tax=Pirellulaceae TaxID=2691357 RepID=UPI001E2C4797|nr:hypothetical protein [Stieleria sp. JC731]MCC9602497.1 hypothetical protein [Stieleria sp. JC731]
MKKLLAIACLVAAPAVCLTGCGESGNKVIQPPEGSTSMTSDQMADYEAQMRSGASSSARPGN